MPALAKVRRQGVLRHASQHGLSPQPTSPASRVGKLTPAVLAWILGGEDLAHAVGTSAPPTLLHRSADRGRQEPGLRVIYGCQMGQAVAGQWGKAEGPTQSPALGPPDLSKHSLEGGDRHMA